VAVGDDGVDHTAACLLHDDRYLVEDIENE
jgi:hypothetical protein